MKPLILTALFILFLLSCKQKAKPGIRNKQAGDNRFKFIAEYPLIKDSVQFMDALKNLPGVNVHISPEQQAHEKIILYKKVRLYGSEKDYYFIEYDYKSGAMVEYPWKYQLVLDTSGKLVKALAATRYSFDSIFKGQHPFLLIVRSSARGNGGHEVYKINADTLENVYEGYYDYNVQTVASGTGQFVFDPPELNLQYADYNKDGYNDMLFTGNKLIMGRYTKDSIWYDVENGEPFTREKPAKIIPVKYIFLYQKKTGHFVAVEKDRS